MDLAAWQAGSKPDARPSTQNAPVAVMQTQNEEANEEDIADFMETANDLTAGALAEGNDVEQVEDDEDDASALEITGSASVRKRGKGTGVTSSGFTSINVPIPRPPTPSSDGDEGVRITGATSGKLVPIIPRDEVDAHERAEFEDFTTGGDVVRRVLKEVKDGGVQVKYKVEFENWSVEVVSVLPILLFWRFLERAAGDVFDDFVFHNLPVSSSLG